MFEPISNGLALRDRIIQDILSKIERREIKPGDRLPSERDLAVQFNVSRTTIRDALRALAAIGVIAIQHGRGIFVQADEGTVLGQALWAPFVVRPENVSALFEVRKTLETAAAGWAALRATTAQREHLRQIVEEAKTQAGGPSTVDPDNAAQADQVFHSSIVAASHNPVAGRIMINLLDLLEQVRRQSLAIPGRAWISMIEHEAIMQAILKGRPEEAQDAMLNHLTGVEVAILQNLSRHE